jgi:hypothetical protein
MQSGETEMGDANEPKPIPRRFRNQWDSSKIEPNKNPRAGYGWLEGVWMVRYFC